MLAMICLQLDAAFHATAFPSVVEAPSSPVRRRAARDERSATNSRARPCHLREVTNVIICSSLLNVVLYDKPEIK
jgi:hypothetical protein